MLTFKQYVRAQSLDEAYALCQKRSNLVLGGMLWLKMQDRTVNTVIDLSGLGLDQIEQTPEGWRIGAMVPLRALEKHPGLAALTNGAMAESVRHIVGVQFRNLATVGGSLYGRFGFSDVLTLFLALGAVVHLHHGGDIPAGQLLCQLTGQIHERRPPPRPLAGYGADQDGRPGRPAPGRPSGGIVQPLGRLNDPQSGGTADFGLSGVVQGVGHRGQGTAALLGDLPH